MTCAPNGYCVSTAVVGQRPRREALAALAASGFCNLELGDPDTLDSWGADPAGLRRDLEALGLAPRSVHIDSAAWDAANPDDAIRGAAVLAGLRSLRQAAEVGAEVVICHPNRPDPDPAAYSTPQGVAASLARTRASLERFAAEAAGLGLRLALENLPARGTPRPGATMGDLLRLIEGLGAHVGICQDVGHSNSNGLDAAADCRAAQGHLFALHLQDNDGLGEDQHLLPGEGTTAWRPFLQALEETGFQGLRTFEVKPWEDLPAILAALVAIVKDWNGR